MDFKLAEVTSQATPASGYVTVYPKTDGLLYWKDAAGTEYPVGTVQLDVENTYTKPQIAGITALTSTGGSVAVNLGQTNDYTLTLTENTTLAAPSNVNPGQSGFITIIQDAGTARTLAYHANWKFIDGATPSISVTLGAENQFVYEVSSTGRVACFLNKFGIA